MPVDRHQGQGLVVAAAVRADSLDRVVSGRAALWAWGRDAGGCAWEIARWPPSQERGRGHGATTEHQIRKQNREKKKVGSSEAKPEEFSAWLWQSCLDGSVEDRRLRSTGWLGRRRRTQAARCLLSQEGEAR